MKNRIRQIPKIGDDRLPEISNASLGFRMLSDNGRTSYRILPYLSRSSHLGQGTVYSGTTI